jgi:hypothetical protein
MRDPATCFDPEVEAAIEETSRFLQSYVQDDAWKGASNITGPAADMDAAVYEIERSALPDWAKNLVVWACLHQKKKKRRGRPSQDYRNAALQWAAVRLVDRYGYKPTRNEATRHRESAASIIRQSLHRLGVRMQEKQINDIVHEAGDIAHDIGLIRDKFGYDVLKYSRG